MNKIYFEDTCVVSVHFGGWSSFSSELVQLTSTSHPPCITKLETSCLFKTWLSLATVSAVQYWDNQQWDTQASKCFIVSLRKLGDFVRSLWMDGWVVVVQEGLNLVGTFLSFFFTTTFIKFYTNVSLSGTFVVSSWVVTLVGLGKFCPLFEQTTIWLSFRLIKGVNSPGAFIILGSNYPDIFFYLVV